MLLKPDTLNGKTIYRGVEQMSGVNHQNEMIVFPPSIVTKHGPVKPLAELVDEAMSKLVIVGDPDGRINISSTAGALEKMFRKVVSFYMKRACLNERERIRLALERHGMKEAQHAMMDGADG
jgi:hypothetical protein